MLSMKISFLIVSHTLPSAPVSSLSFGTRAVAVCLLKGSAVGRRWILAGDPGFVRN